MSAAPHCLTGYPPRRLRPLLWASILSLGLVACAPSIGANANLGWTEAGSPKRLEVDPAEYRHTVYFDTDKAQLTALERDRLLAFIDSVQPNGRDSIRLQGHADDRASDLYNLELAGRRNESVATYLRQLGLTDVTMSSYGEKVPAAAGEGPEAWRQNRRVEVVIERYLVTLPACPDWSRESGTDFANLPHSNQGCATETNLGLMVADPKDLVRGRSLGPADGVHEAEAIVRYRTGKVVELKEEKVQN